MTTPLKALIQERLRAKIVRSGDDDNNTSNSNNSGGNGSRMSLFEDDVSSSDAYGDSRLGGMTASLANTTPLIDPSEYLVPPPLSAAASSAKEQQPGRKYDTSTHHRHPTTSSKRPVASKQQLPHRHDDAKYAAVYAVSRYRTSSPVATPLQQDTAADHSHYDGYEAYARPRRAMQSRRLAYAAPVASSTNTRTVDDLSTTNQDAEPQFRNSRLVDSRKRPYRSDYSPPPRSTGEFDRYRNDNKRQYGGSTSISQEDQTDSHPTTLAWPQARRTYAKEPRYEGYETFHQQEQPRYKTEAHDSTANNRWTSPPRKNGQAAVVHQDAARESVVIRDRDDPAEPTPSRRWDRHSEMSSYSVRHKTAVYPVTPETNNWAFSPTESRYAATYQRSYTDRPTYAAHRDEQVHHARGLAIRTSVRSHQQQRSDSRIGSTSEQLERIKVHDDILSPGSHQTAQAFVDKRQKRSSQGTPRTMATHRWLQSMMDARQEQKSALPQATENDPHQRQSAFNHNNNNNNNNNDETMDTNNHIIERGNNSGNDDDDDHEQEDDDADDDDVVVMEPTSSHRKDAYDAFDQPSQQQQQQKQRTAYSRHTPYTFATSVLL